MRQTLKTDSRKQSSKQRDYVKACLLASDCEGEWRFVQVAGLEDDEVAVAFTPEMARGFDSIHAMGQSLRQMVEGALGETQFIAYPIDGSRENSTHYAGIDTPKWAVCVLVRRKSNESFWA